MSESETLYRERHLSSLLECSVHQFPLVYYKDGETCVFWDVEDYPIPDGHYPLWMKEKIEEALKKKGYCGKISIQAYVDKNTYSPELEKKYSDANIKLDTLSKGRQLAKSASMFVDVVMLAFDKQYQSNFIVLSKKTDNEDTYSFAKGLFRRGYCVLLSTTRSGWYGPSQPEACFLTSLFDGGTSSGSLDNNKRKREDTLSGSEL